MQTDPAWHDNLIFSEYFHGDNGAAIGAFAGPRLDRGDRRRNPRQGMERSKIGIVVPAASQRSGR